MIPSVHTQVGTQELLHGPNYSTLSTRFMDSVVILHRPLTNEYINAVSLFQ